MIDLTDSALGLAAQGVAVFPCKPDKSPATPHGYHDATTDPDRIKAWTWDGMIGAVVPEGQVVIDIDPRNGGDATIDALAERGLHLSDTLTVKTGGGGLHYYYLIPESLT